MNKYVVTLKDGQPICTVIKSDKSQYTMEGAELIQFLGRIDEGIYGRKSRKNPLYNKKDKGPSLIYINKLQGKNVQLRNYPELARPLRYLYLENRKEVRADLDKRKKVLIGKAAAGVMIGGIALAILGDTAAKTIDLETTATYEEEVVKEINTQELINIEIIPEEEVKNIIEDTEDELTNEELESIENELIQLNVDPVYDPGIDQNVDNYLDEIRAASQRRGISESLIYDVMSQESAGKGDNLGQFEFNAWKDEVLKIYNFEKQAYEKIVFTDTPDKYQGKVDVIVTRKDMQNKKTQAYVIGINLQHYCRLFNNNILIALNAYNNGYQRTMDAITRYAEDKGITVQDVIDNRADIGWLEYVVHDEHGLTYDEEVGKHINADQLADGINDPWSIQTPEGEIITVQVQAAGRQR